jgi:hypothetical protein
VSCGACRFWHDTERERYGGMPLGADIGQCRKRAPSITQQDQPRWPPSRRDEWCGEFFPRDHAAEQIAPGVWALPVPGAPR